ncbi:MAG TPA: NAD(P)H-dependent oxidoreductase subunit E [Actinomycetota bacterium]
MDLHLLPASATDEERAAVDGILGQPESGWVGGSRTELDGHIARGGRAAREQRHLLLPVLHAVQSRVGWISEGALGYVAQRLTIPPAEAYGVASFYALFSTEPRPKTVVHVCDDIACRVNGAEDLCASLEREFGPPGSDRDGATWLRSPCLGMCEAAPAALVQNGSLAGHDVSVGVARIADLVREAGLGDPSEDDAPYWRSETRLSASMQRGGSAGPLLTRVGKADPTSLDSYRSHGGYEALRTAVALGPEGVIREVKDANLLGRGGAAFPTGVKWEAVAKQPVRPHFFVCNADESEPGTFKDRVVMEADPFAVVEALTIAGYATGSEAGYLYIRGEYPLAHERLRNAIEQCRARGFLGANVMGEGFAFDIELRRGAGAYIAGEETALFNSIEGKRAEPRNKPPFPVTHGVFGKPTGINNVETLLNVLEILRIGGPAFARIGTPDSTGTRLFCLSGCVERPGLYEIEFGTTLRELLDQAGGVREGRALQAILLGGAAGAFVTPDDLDLRLTFEDARAAGVSLGSGVVMAFDDTVDLVDIVLRIAAFFRDESCGQCVPCRVGTVRQEEALRRLADGRSNGGTGADLALIDEIAQVMRDASICGLGQTAAGAVQSAIAKLRLFDGAGSR